MKILFNEPQDSAVSIESPPKKSWEASLMLGFEKSEVNTKTILRNKLHHGPLLVQKTLYPENNEVCHAVILHPPAGIAGGDHLKIETHLAKDTKVVITNPGATKWYKANKFPSSQLIRITLEEGAYLDFLPQENIFFDETIANSHIQVHLNSNASMIGWDISQFGRSIFGEPWANARFDSDIELYLNHRLMWIEKNQLLSEDVALHTQPLLDKKRVMGVMWMSSPNASQDMLEAISEHLPWREDIRCGATKIELSSEYGVILIRALADEVESLKECFIDVWLKNRLAISGLAPMELRLWKT